MLPRYLIGPAVLLLWQAAPVGVVTDEGGRLRLAFGAALGSYEELRLGCAGEEVEVQEVTYESVGGSVEYWPNQRVRLEVQAGTMVSDAGEGSVVATPYGGWHGRALVAVEGRRVGVGGSLAVLPWHPFEEDRTVLPGVYLRVGSRDGLQGRLEFGGMAFPGAPPESYRFALGGGLGRGQQISWQLSAGGSEYPASRDLLENYSARLGVPVTAVLELGAGASVQDGGFGLGIFGRFRAPPPVR